MARDWCVVSDTLSWTAAQRLGKALRAEGVDLEVEASFPRVKCFADDESRALALQAHVLRVVEALPEPTLHGAPQARVWNAQLRSYVDPAAPDEDPDSTGVWVDSELAPEDVAWRVRLHLEAPSELRRVRRQLPALRRPVIAATARHVDLGARDLADAQETAARASALEGVAAAEPRQIRGRLARWRVRQRIAGNYAH